MAFNTELLPYWWENHRKNGSWPIKAGQFFEFGIAMWTGHCFFCGFDDFFTF
jgi:hypothetical protein